MAYKVLEKKMSETGKRVDFVVEFRPGFLQKAFEPYKVKGYIVSPQRFDDGLAEIAIAELMDNKSKWIDCKKKACTQTYALTTLQRANAYVEGIASEQIKNQENDDNSPTS